MEHHESEASGANAVDEYTNGVRIIVLNLPEDEGEGLGFRLTRTLWDPYPWVREVTANSRADAAGLMMGDCILQADGKDLLGMPVGQVAGLIRGDGGGRGVTLLVWNCGVDPNDDPELLWSCGGGARGEKARRALSGVVRALACCVCLATVTAPLCCARSHLYCAGCWSRMERCALCREQLPSKDSPYARNLVAEQVFEAIATEYEIKNVKRRLTETASAYASPNRSPNRSPNMSPSVQRRGQYQLSMMNRKKHVQFDRYGQNYASDPNIHSSSNQEAKRTNLLRNPPGNSGFQSKLMEKRQVSASKLLESSTQRSMNEISQVDLSSAKSCCNQNIVIENPLKEKADGSAKLVENSAVKATNSGENLHAGSSKKCSCQKMTQDKSTQNTNCPQIKVDSCTESLVIPHKVVATLRQACSMADLQNVVQTCQMSRSLKNLGECKGHGHHSSLDSLKTQCCNVCEPPVFLVSAPPIYVVTCDHTEKE